MQEETSFALVDKRGFFHGGGGGIRTRVLTIRTSCFYMCSRMISFIPCLANRRALAGKIPPMISPFPDGHGKGQPVNLASDPPQAEGMGSVVAFN